MGSDPGWVVGEDLSKERHFSPRQVKWPAKHRTEEKSINRKTLLLGLTEMKEEQRI